MQKYSFLFPYLGEFVGKHFDPRVVVTLIRLRYLLKEFLVSFRVAINMTVYSLDLRFYTVEGVVDLGS